MSTECTEQAPAAHLTSWTVFLVVFPQPRKYSLEQTSSIGMARFFTICNQALGLGFRTSPVRASTQAIAASASSVWNKEKWQLSSRVLFYVTLQHSPSSLFPACCGSRLVPYSSITLQMGP